MCKLKQESRKDVRETRQNESISKLKPMELDFIGHLHWLAVTGECFDLLLVSLASNKSQQHISPQWPHRGHQSQARDIGRQLGWSRAKLLSVLISYCRITDYASLPGESSLPRVTWRPPRTCTQVGCQNYPGNMSAKQYSVLLPFSPFSVLQNIKKMKEYISVTQKAGWEFIISLTIKFLLQK